MPSEPAATPSGAARLLALIGSQGLGVACGLSTVLLLAVGSVVLVATAGGASQNVAMDDLRGFFAEPSWAHLWLYLLVPVLSVFALNTFVGALDDVVARWRAGLRAPSAYAAALLHVGFLLALVAHLVGGFWGEEGNPVVIGARFVELDHGRAARVEKVDVTRLPNGMLEQAYATLEVRDTSGRTHVEVVSYNAPLSFGFGSELYVLTRQGNTGEPTVVLRHRHTPANPLALGAATLLGLGTLLMWRRFV
jgi:hypothetical protein